MNDYDGAWQSHRETKSRITIVFLIMTVQLLFCQREFSLLRHGNERCLVPHLVIFDGCLSVSFLYSYHKFILVVMTWRSSLPVPQETQAVRVSGWVFDVTRVWVGINASYGKVEKFKNLYNYIIGLHAVQFGNNWMRKIRRTAKLDEAVGRVQFVSQRNFSNSIIFKLDSMLSYYVLIILYARIEFG